MDASSSVPTSTPTNHRYRSATPWPIRVFVVVAILFGIWVDVSNADWKANPRAAHHEQTALLGLNGDHSRTADVVRAFASRR